MIEKFKIAKVSKYQLNNESKFDSYFSKKIRVLIKNKKLILH